MASQTLVGRAIRRAITCGSITLLACGEGKSPPTAASDPVAAVVLSRDTATLVPTATVQLAATPKDASGSPLSRSVTWSSSDPSRATVSASGLVTGVATGAATVTATSEGRSNQAQVTVKEGAIVGASGATISALSGVATVTLPAGAVPANTMITVENATSPPANPRLVASTAVTLGPSGLTFAQPVELAIKYAPQNLGAGPPEALLRVYRVNGNAWEEVSGSQVDVAAKIVKATLMSFSTYGVFAAPSVASVSVTPAMASIAVSATTTLTASLRDANGNEVAGRSVTWTTSNAAIATASATGVVTGVAAGGPVTITATSEGKSGSASVTVTEVAVASVTVSPATTSIVVGATFQFTAVLHDANGNVLTGRIVGWASSNTAIATVSASGLVTGVAPGGPVFIVAASGGKTGSARATITPTVGPSVIVFQAGSGDAREIWRIDPDGTDLTRITDNTVADLGPQISPDGSQIALARAGDLFVMNADGSNAKLVITESLGAGIASPAWSPDGAYIVYLDPTYQNLFDVRYDVAIATVTGTFLRRLTSNTSTGDASNLYRQTPSWSSDGAYVLFSQGTIGNQDIVRAPSLGGTPMAVISTPDQESQPEYSPDGLRIVFYGSRNGVYGVYLVNADGTGTPVRVGPVDASNPTWSPDGQRIAFTLSQNGFNDIWVMNADGSAAVNITNTPAITETSPHWGRKAVVP